jgi:cysteine synthase A
MFTKTNNKIANSALDLIGNTPIVKLNNLSNEKSVEIFAKLEMFNPGSSVKDRIALSMIEDAERKGYLIPGKSTIIEPTSGNTGIGLAMVAATKGYTCIIIIPDSMSLERRKVLNAFGAKVVLTPGAEGFKGAIEETEKRMKRIANPWSPMQINNMANPLVHYQQTGKKIWDDMNGDLDIFVCSVGTGGTLTGVGEFLKSQNPKIKVVAVEPFNSALLSGGSPGQHKIQGLNAGFISKTTNVDIIDEVIKVKDEDAFQTTVKLSRKEGLFVGISSGAAAWGAMEVSKDPTNKGKKIVTIFPDTGERYLSTNLWN